MIKVNLEKFLNNIENYIPKKVSIIGICGGSASGKSFVAKKISETLGGKVINLDDYIIPEIVKTQENLELPNVWNLKLVRQNLINIKKKKKFEKPIYDFKSKKIIMNETILPEKLFIFEGLHTFSDIIYKFFDLKIFIEADENVRFKRRLQRDISERNHKREKIIKRWKETVQPSFIEFIQPTKSKSDLIIINNQLAKSL